MTRHVLLLSLVLLLGSTAFAEDRFCENERFVFDARYDGGDLDKCKFKSDGSVELTFRPEDFKVDDAFSWFSFRVSAAEPDTARILLKFPDSYARFWPKVSTDGINWEPMPEESVTVSRTGKNMDLAIEIGATDTWVSAQELVTQAFYDQWFEELSANEEITIADIGKSVDGRPIHVAKTSNKSEVVFLLGRQHPGEVPGALAMRGFVDVLLGDSDLARQFRERAY